MAIALVVSGFAATCRYRADLSRRPYGSEVSNLLMNPEKIELEYEERSKAGAVLDNLDTLKSRRTKLQHAVERLIDSFTEGLIAKDQFASRTDRTKRRIADLDAKIREDAGDVDQRRVSDMRQIVLGNWRQPSGQTWLQSALDRGLCSK